MADTNKVEFGVSQLHIGTYTVADDGTVTMGTPLALKGAKSLSLDPEGDENSFYADNVKYWSDYSDNGFSGTMEVARFTDAFKTQFLGYSTLADGGVAAVKTATKPKVYIAFQAEGDAQSRRGIMYNVTLGGISREYATKEDSTEPTTESIDITVTGDNATGLTLVTYGADAAGYSTVFSAPPAPVAPVAPPES